MKRHFPAAAACTALLGLCSAATAGAATLTGVIVFTTNSTGSSTLQNYENTYGGDNFSYNLYVLSGLPAASLNSSNPFLNSGNFTTTPTTISFDLSSPGTYSYTFLGDTNAGTLGSYVGMNLFFDGSNNVPGISTYEAANFTSPSFYPTYLADSAASTATLNPMVNGGVHGSGSLSFIDGASQITLSEFRYSDPSVFKVDRVSGYQTGSNGANDLVTEMTLTVTTVPEPASAAAISMTATGLLTRRRRKS